MAVPLDQADGSKSYDSFETMLSVDTRQSDKRLSSGAFSLLPEDADTPYTTAVDLLLRSRGRRLSASYSTAPFWSW